MVLGAARQSHLGGIVILLFHPEYCMQCSFELVKVDLELRVTFSDLSSYEDGCFTAVIARQELETLKKK